MSFWLPTWLEHNTWRDITAVKWRHMSRMTPQITCDSTVCLTAFQVNNKEMIKAAHHWPFVNNLPVILGFPSQRVSDAESVFMSWRLHKNTSHVPGGGRHPCTPQDFSKQMGRELSICFGVRRIVRVRIRKFISSRHSKTNKTLALALVLALALALTLTHTLILTPIVHLVKAFDRVPRHVICFALRSDWCALYRICVKMYIMPEAECVLVANPNEVFSVKLGVHQCSFMSSLLFSKFLEAL